jgi:hypothetical protein
MHLLLAQQGTISDGEEAVDLGQSPGDILFLSAADTELAAIAAAHGQRKGSCSLRLASLMSLRHPMSVDTYVGRTARHARLVIVRALGGASYFQYALEALHASAARSGALIAVLPGDARPDAGLTPFSNVALDDLNALWAYLVEGGEANARGFLDYAEAILSGGEKPAPAVPLMKAGIWWPGRGLIGVEEWRKASAAFAAPPSVLPDISPTRGEIGSAQRLPQTMEDGMRRGVLPISPRVGEMSGRTEGGIDKDIGCLLLRRHHQRFKRDRQAPPFVAHRDDAHLALVGAERLAGLERDHPVVQRAGDGIAVHDAFRQRAALVRAAVLDRMDFVFARAEDGDGHVRRLHAARAAQRNVRNCADRVPVHQ